MASVINLNKFRKRKAKLAKERQAETNRRLHGRTAAERAADDLRKKRLHAKVDGAKLVLEKATDDANASGEDDAHVEESE